MSGEHNKGRIKSDKHEDCEGCVPFESVEEVWFWFITAQQARNDGARYVEGAGSIRQPCEPIDILKVLDSLYRKRRFLRDHLLVLRHYGRRCMAPDPRRVKEKRAHHLWCEAFELIGPVLQEKGIIASYHWAQQYDFAFLQEGELA
jgi:hypothetical protein